MRRWHCALNVGLGRCILAGHGGFSINRGKIKCGYYSLVGTSKLQQDSRGLTVRRHGVAKNSSHASTGKRSHKAC